MHAREFTVSVSRDSQSFCLRKAEQTEPRTHLEGLFQLTAILVLSFFRFLFGHLICSIYLVTFSLSERDTGLNKNTETDAQCHQVTRLNVTLALLVAAHLPS